MKRFTYARAARLTLLSLALVSPAAPALGQDGSRQDGSGGVQAAASPALSLACASQPSTPRWPSDGAQLTADALDGVGAQLMAYSSALNAYGSCLLDIVDNRDDHAGETWFAALDAYNAISTAQDDAWSQYDRVSSEWRDANVIDPDAAAD